jgi:hypothetical protein
MDHQQQTQQAYKPSNISPSIQKRALETANNIYERLKPGLKLQKHQKFLFTNSVKFRLKFRV